MDSKELTREIIGAAIEVHRVLGPGLLESAYVECLCHELALREIPFRREVALPLTYKGCKLDCGYRLDLLVAETVVIEAKSIDALLPIHDAQLLSYLRLGGWSIGLLINFNVPLLKDGVHRRVLSFEDSSASSASLR
jgi:GxxExxY protein